VGYQPVFFDPEPGLGQIKHLSASYYLAFSLEGQAALLALGGLMVMNGIRPLNALEGFARMTRLSACFFARFFR